MLDFAAMMSGGAASVLGAAAPTAVAPEVQSPWTVLAQSAVLIFFAELGDKTFFVAMLLTGKYRRPFVVFSGCMLALATSTVLAALVGHFLASFLDPNLLEIAAGLLFLGMGAYILLEWSKTAPDAELEGLAEAEEEVEKEKTKIRSRESSVGAYGGAAQASSEPFDQSKSPASSSSAPVVGGATTTVATSGGDEDLASTPWFRVLLLSFSMNFLGELGDKTQLAVVAQAAGHSAFWVACGAMLGFALVTAIAVVFGEQISKRLSQRAVLLGAGVTFLLFGAVSLVFGLNSYLAQRPEAAGEAAEAFAAMKVLLSPPRTSPISTESAMTSTSTLLAHSSSVLRGGGRTQVSSSSPWYPEDVKPLLKTPDNWSFGAVFGCGALVGGLVVGILVAAWMLWGPGAEKLAASRGPSRQTSPDVVARRPETPMGSGRFGGFVDIPRTTSAGSTDYDDEEVESLHLFKHRVGWLVGLLLVQSLSAFVLSSFGRIMLDHPSMFFYLTMLVGAGGSAGAQSAVLAVRQLALKRPVSIVEQLSMGIKIAAVLVVVAVLRTLLGGVNVYETSAIAISLVLIVVLSVVLGTAIPLFLHRLGYDPAHGTAAIQVIMDILGGAITCLTAVLLLDYILDAPHHNWEKTGKYL